MWCGPCNQAGAHAQAVQDTYAADNLIYVTVLVDNLQGDDPSLEDLQHWASAYGNTSSPVVAGERTMLQSSGGDWNLTSWPTFFYIDREMVIRDVDKGYNSTEVTYSIEWLLTL
jgi:thiol-disulfide isomerase/thioredoxin